MALFDDPIEPHSVESLRRSIAMLRPGQAVTIDRERAMAVAGSSCEVCSVS